MLALLIGNKILVYPDDILIYARKSKRLLEMLANVLRLLKRVNLNCREKKCELFERRSAF